MSDASGLARNWTDSLSAFSIGALAIASFTAPLKVEGSAVSVDFDVVSEYRSYFANFDSIETAFVMLILSGVFLAVGQVVTQFGELLSILADMLAGNDRPRDRVKAVTENPVLVEIYRSAYRTFRLLCGFGGLVSLMAFRVVFDSLVGLSWKGGISGIALFIFGWVIAGRFARYSFTHLDWLMFRKIDE
ncbi:hypothetical protein CVM52_20570 [Pseudooceanicola lipolyticus]|uniref:Uncharacterized protein n=1 Tax=Pseudooceanicola lipolyticus TaxID=2029104 RepID=A0A2M8IW50_9RHOB|nr:hypothetical protein [Pseudooceanicola lipolyticus]PJE34763.1 hypothetical protein CVM52_20570 [Pseudooceanicola lipolyticus]